MMISIKETNQISINGLPIVQIKSGDKIMFAERIEDEYQEYDKTVESISYNLQKELDENETEIVRRESRKSLIKVSRGYVGFHTYRSNQDNYTVDKIAVVMWTKRKDNWYPSRSMGDLTMDDAIAINKAMTEYVTPYSIYKNIRD